jgi:hypothetical protein
MWAHTNFIGTGYAPGHDRNFDKDLFCYDYRIASIMDVVIAMALSWTAITSPAHQIAACS